MNINLLIDAIVRQTVILIAQLATTAGARAQLAHVANEVFLSLVNELKAQGLGQKVIADMFGLALRTYHNKLQRLSESRTERGRSLWEAVLAYIAERQVVLRADILRHFIRDDEQSVRAVLNDLVESELIFRTGRGDRIAYRAASADELPLLLTGASEAARVMVQVAVHRLQPASREEVQKLVPLSDEELQAALEALVEAGDVQRDEDDPDIYTCDQCVVPFEAAVGWEAAVFDHYQAMVTSICIKLNRGAARALPQDAVGGSTWGLDVWPGHPLEDEALSTLRRIREQLGELRQRIDAYNKAQTPAPPIARRIIFYAGQSVLDDLPAPSPEGEHSP